MMITKQTYGRFYDSDVYNGTLHFFRWVRTSVTPQMHVLNVGAGPATGNPIQVLKGEVARLVGVDVDPIVLRNAELDEGIVTDGGCLPFADSTFDLAFADFVLEHVGQPAVFLREISRVLKPGAPFYFRTPNQWHYVTIISRLTTHAFHRRIANWVRGLDKAAHEPWPTFYRMNTMARLKKLAKDCGFSSAEFRFFEGQPSYLVFHIFPFLVGVAYERIVNRFSLLAHLRANIFGRFVRQE